MKRAITLTLCVITVAVGLWVVTASHTLNSACALDARAVANACITGWPFYLLGGALALTGVVSSMIVLGRALRDVRRVTTRPDESTISTLPRQGEKSLREVA
jgi:hypothetical protein